MSYKPESILIKNHKLSYRVYSGGNDYLFVFHGYGQSADIFETFIHTVIADYTVIAIELFFHGNSEVLQQKKTFISIEEWNELFGEILKQHAIEKFSILSFSIGSRFVFATLYAYASRIDRLALIAPDGFGNTFWFRLATSNVLCRLVFKLVLNYPFLIIYPARFLHVAGIIHGATSNFIQKSLQSPIERKRIYNTWVYFRKLNMHASTFVHTITVTSINVLFVTGKNDDLVAQDAIKKISDQLESQYIEFPFAHAKMVQAINSEAVLKFFNYG